MTTAITAHGFIATLGVDTHLPYGDSGYTNIGNVEADLAYLGITNVRDGISNGGPGTANFSTYVTLAQQGVKFTFCISGGGAITTASMNATLALIAQLNTDVPGSVVAVEGLNEINNSAATYNGIGGLTGSVDLQSDLYAAVHANPALAGVAVDYFTGYNAGTIAVGPDPATMSGLADFDTQHPYPNFAQPPAAWVAPAQALGNEAAPYGLAVYTETGYTTDQVSQDVQAKYTLDLLMDDAKNGITETYLYQLLDGYAPGSPQGDDGYGLFDPNNQPKEAATAIHNLTSVLADTGATAATFTPTSLAYSVTGLPATGNSLLIEKSHGTFDVVVWNEPAIWNTATNTEIQVAPVSVTVQLVATYQTVEVFDPLVSASPIEILSGVSSIALSLTDHPLIVEVEPQSTPTTPITPPSGSSGLVLYVAEIAMNGKDAQFIVSVDGIQIGGVQTVTGQQTAGGGQIITWPGTFAAGQSHTIAITMLDGFTGVAADYGRTLLVDAVTLNGVTVFPDWQLMYNNTLGTTVQLPASPVVSNAGTQDTLILNLAETAVGGKDTLFMVSVDGQLVGGIETVTAAHAAGQSQNITLTGDFGSGSHLVSIDFLNGFSGNAADAGRTLYLNAITLDGRTTTESASFAYDGATSFSVQAGTVQGNTVPVVVPPAAPGALSLAAASDSGAVGDDLTNVAKPTINGTASAGMTVRLYDEAGLIGTATASAGGTWSITLAQSLPDGTHTLYATAVDGVGDVSVASPTLSLTIDTQAPPTPASPVLSAGSGDGTPGETQSTEPTITGAAAANALVSVYDGSTLLGTTTANGSSAWSWTPQSVLALGMHEVTVTATDGAGNVSAHSAALALTVAAPPPPPPPPVTPPSGSSELVLYVAEIAMNGKDAQFTVRVDGTQVGGVQTVTGQQVAGGGQIIALPDTVAAGASHTIAITMLDGFTGVAADYGRMLFVNAVALGGVTAFPDAQLLYNNTITSTIQLPTSPVVSNAGTQDTLVLNLAETAVGGKDALFMVSVDGQLVGGIQTVTASHAAGQSQNITLTGDFGSGSHAVAIDFLNGFSGNAADAGRTLYLNAITLDGRTTTENASFGYDGATSFSAHGP